VYHPVEFYAAALTKYGDKKQNELLRDAVHHGITITPPDPTYSSEHWRPILDPDLDDWQIIAGFAEIPGIGEKVAARIIEWQDPLQASEWDNLHEIKGVGGKTIDKIKAFCAKDDPFDIFKLDRMIAGVKAEIRSGKLGRLPWPTHTGLQVPYVRGKDTEVVWIGTIINRNLRELFEVNFSRTGQALDPKSVKDPELNEWVIMVGNDGSELLTITIDRWKYPKYREAIWGLRPGIDLALIRGVKRGYQSRRAVYVHQMWIVDPTDDDDEE
jgi:DNA polymerase-3 subunit alpha